MHYALCAMHAAGAGAALDARYNVPVCSKVGGAGLCLSVGGVVRGKPVNMGGSSSKKPFVGAHQQTLTGHDDSVLCCAFSPDSKWLATSSADHTVIIWSTKNFKPKHRLQGHHSADVTAVSFSPGSDLLISCKAQQYYFYAL